DENLTLEELTTPLYGSVIIEGFLDADLEGLPQIKQIGVTNNHSALEWKGEKIKLSELLPAWEEPLEGVFPTRAIPAARPKDTVVSPQNWNERNYSYPKTKTPAPRVAILALPGTNCEYDSRRAFELAGSAPVEPFIFRNQSAFDAQKSCEEFARLVRNSQILMLPGGFSAGDEPEGSGKFFVSVFRNPMVRDAVEDLIQNRDGLVLGICNGFQALVKTGLLPFGHIRNLDENAPTLSYNNIGRHISQIVRTRVASVKSPWLALHEVGDIHMMAVSHGEGRFTAPNATLKKLFENGQVVFQYVDLKGAISLETPFNPNGSDYGIEGICSPDGRVLGKMGHTERAGSGLLINNAYGDFSQKLFAGGVAYFK
ncbi:MAG: phosphoribosylformylglycinamidine synthase subunit PurQ, partial [Desulfovibrionaceae bacterium]|nr:phosphoribosylformylglycinamidine synthase subunit PurQ [Desulfovibrionaceae bacterium]